MPVVMTPQPTPAECKFQICDCEGEDSDTVIPIGTCSQNPADTSNAAINCLYDYDAALFPTIGVAGGMCALSDGGKCCVQTKTMECTAKCEASCPPAREPTQCVAPSVAPS